MGSIRYRVDVLEALKSAGWSTYRIKQTHVLAEATLQKIRRGEPVSWLQMARLCGLLDCQPGELLEYVPDVDTPREGGADK